MSPEPREVKPKAQAEDGGWSAGQVKQYADERIAELQRAVDVAREGSPPHVQLQEYIEKILDEKHRGLQVAEQEREKAARALRIELDRAISEGDRALREHIDQQFQQVRAALDSADLLELERVKLIDEKIDGYEAVIDAQRELFDEKFKSVDTQFRLNQTALDAALQTQKEAAAARDESNQKAIDKSEAATSERTTKLSELMDSNINALRDKYDELARRFDRMA